VDSNAALYSRAILFDTQGEMHPFMTAILLWMSRFDPFDADS
jgi:hypothetical protein